MKKNVLKIVSIIVNINKDENKSLISNQFSLKNDFPPHFLENYFAEVKINQRLPGACNRSPGSKLLSITTQLHCGGHLGGRAQLPDTILEEDHPMTIPSKFGFN